jgi:hypothetical protein
MTDLPHADEEVIPSAQHSLAYLSLLEFKPTRPFAQTSQSVTQRHHMFHRLVQTPHYHR